MFGQQVIDRDILQDHILVNGRVLEVLVHRDGTFKQLDAIKTEHCRRHQPDRRQHAESPTNPVRHAENLIAPNRLRQVVQLAAVAGNRNHQSR